MTDRQASSGNPARSGDDDLVSRQVVAELRERAQAGWDSIADRVLDQVRATAREGRLLSIGSPSSRPAGDLTVREHALRALLARTLRIADHPASEVDLDLDGGRLVGVRVGLRGPVSGDLDAVVSLVRRVVMSVVRDVLGDARHSVLTQSIEVSVSSLPPAERKRLS